MKRGNLIVLTGIDGSGKTTQAKLLVEALQLHELKVTYVWNRWEQLLVKPLTKLWKRNLEKDTGSSDGRAKDNKQRKQNMLSNPLIRKLWLSAFFVDYGLQIALKVRVRLLRKQMVISDRMFYDSVIDQAVNLGSNKDWLLDNLDSEWMKVIFPKPDMVFYIDCPGEIAFSRKKDAPDVEYLTDRRELYTYLAERYKWNIIDGTQSVNEIAVKIKDRILKEYTR